MKAITFTTESEFIEALQARIGARKPTDVVRTALTVLSWVAEESSAGRAICSVNRKDQSDIRELSVPGLTKLL